MNKAPDAFRTISEVADDLDLPQHVLRFWESRFPQIRPMKRGGGRRYYRPEDVDLLRGIRHLLYGEGYTIRGVQRILREQGLRTVQSVGQGRAVALPSPDDTADVEDGNDEAADAESGPGLKFLPPRLSGASAREAPATDEAPTDDDEPDHEGDDARNGVRRSSPGERTAGPLIAPKRIAAESRGAGGAARGTGTPAMRSEDAVSQNAISDDEASDDAASETAPMAAASSGARQDGPVAGLAPEDLDRLRFALHRLQECRQLLDQAHDRVG